MNEKEMIKVVQDNAEKISQSEIFVSLVTKNYLNDPYCAMQLGLAVLLDKPIYLLVKEGTPIPRNLMKIAVKYELFDENNIKWATDKLLNIGRG